MQAENALRKVSSLCCCWACPCCCACCSACLLAFFCWRRPRTAPAVAPIAAPVPASPAIAPNGCSTSRSTARALHCPSLLLVGFLRGRRSGWINPSLLLSGCITSAFVVSLLLGSLLFLRVNEDSDFRSGGTR